jgi:hypothetical protein
MGSRIRKVERKQRDKNTWAGLIETLMIPKAKLCNREKQYLRTSKNRDKRID